MTHMIRTLAANPMVCGAEMFGTKTIVENAMTSADHTTLIAAVQAAGLVETLQGARPFSVFAPTDEAFGNLPDGTIDKLLLPQNKDKLTKVLTCHVVAADAMSDAIMGMIAAEGGKHRIRTAGGCEFTAMTSDGLIQIMDGQGNIGTVTIADVEQSNGLIHVIDTVLLPAM